MNMYTKIIIKNIMIRFILTILTVAIIIIVVSIASCGFAIDPTENIEYIEIEGPTKYKKLVVGYCNFKISVEVDIPTGWDHWKNNIHQFAVMSGTIERGRYSNWDNLYTDLACGFCIKGLTGIISVLDSKDNLVPWGCGPERPPLKVLRVTSTFISPTGATPIQNESDAKWENTSLEVYERTFVPELTADEKFCDGDFVLFNLDEACEALVDAGVMQKL